MRVCVTSAFRFMPLVILLAHLMPCAAQLAQQPQTTVEPQNMPQLVPQTTGGMPYGSSSVFGADGHWLATASAEGDVLLFDLLGGRVSKRFEDTGARSVLASHPTKNLLAVLSDRSSQSMLMLYDVSRAVMLWKQTTALQCTAIHFSPDGSRLFGICSPRDSPTSSMLKGWDTASGSEVATPAIAEGYTVGIFGGTPFSEDGQWVVAGRLAPAITQPNGKMTRNPFKAMKLAQQYMSAMQDRAIVETSTGKVVAHLSALIIWAVSARAHTAIVMDIGRRPGPSLLLTDVLNPSAKPSDIDSASYLSVQPTRDGTHFALFGQGSATLVDATSGRSLQPRWDHVPMLGTGVIANDGDQVAYAQGSSVTLFRFSKPGEGEILGSRQQALLLATGAPDGGESDPVVHPTGLVVTSDVAANSPPAAVAASRPAPETGHSPKHPVRSSADEPGIGGRLKDAVPVYGIVRQIRRQKQQSREAKEAAVRQKAEASQPQPESASEQQMKRAFLTFGGPIMVPPEPVFLDSGRLLAVRSADFTWGVWDVATGNHVTGRSTPPDLQTITESSVWQDRSGLIEVSKLLGITGTDASTAEGGNTPAEARSTDRQQVFAHPIPGSAAPTNATGTDDPAGYGIRVSDASGKFMFDLPDARGDASALQVAPGGRVLVGADHTRSLGLWDRGTGARLGFLTAYQEGEWLLTTPSGLFDGSPRGWQQIAWTDPKGGNATLPGEAFFSEFYHPGLLAELLAGHAPQPPRSLAQIDRRQPVIQFVGGNAATADKAVELRLNLREARDGGLPGGVRDVRLFRNDVLVHAWRGDLKLEGGEATLSIRVPLIAGENRFSAYAFNHDNVKSLDTKATVQCNRSPDPRTAYVVSVGINRYSNPEFNLNFAVPDATHFSDVLSKSLKDLGQYGRIVQLNLINEDATKLNIQSTLDVLNGRADPKDLPPLFAELRQSRPEDTVILYFAGHGIAWDDHFYLIPHDLGFSGTRAELPTALHDVLSHSLSDLDLEDRLNPLDAANIMLIIDACNSGKALDADEIRRGPMNSKGLAQLAYEKGMYVLTASQAYQAALESSRLGHGYLTYALTDEGLLTKRADAAPIDDKISVIEWFEYASRRVPQMQSEALNTAATSGNRKIIFETGDLPENHSRLQTPRLYYRREQQGAEPIVSLVDDKP